MKKTAALLLAFTVMLLLCISASAQTIVPELPCALHLNYQDENDDAIAELPVSLYRVAELSVDGEAAPTSAFSGYGLDDDALSNRADTASKLSEYVQRDSVAPDHQGKTDSEGKLSFDNLTTGIYLITSDSISDGRTVLRTQPLLLDLPMIDERSGVYAYEVTASPKPVRTKIMRELNLVVLWRDEADPSKRPDSVTVELYRDGELFDTKKVGPDNGWRYTWSEVDDPLLAAGSSYTGSDNYADATDRPQDHTISGEHSWYVVEHRPDGYTVTYAVRPAYNTFVIINTLDKPSEPQLPQTGQLWWPVPILAVIGVVLILFGLRRTRRHHEA